MIEWLESRYGDNCTTYIALGNIFPLEVRGENRSKSDTHPYRYEVRVFGALLKSRPTDRDKAKALAIITSKKLLTKAVKWMEENE